VNTLAYTLLSLLTRQPYTGYDLTRIMEVFWRAKHSQVYPLLAKLESDGYVVSQWVEQSGKPNKKVYTITEKGLSKLKQWLQKPPAPPVIRDEFLVKVIALRYFDKESAISLVTNRMETYLQKAAAREAELNLMREEHGSRIESMDHPFFGRYVFFMRALRLEAEEAAWCKWVLDLIRSDK
jgi:DNA-binding PadR family transcriptional regulator